LAHTMTPSNEFFVDTVAYVENEKGNIVIPAKYNFGLTYDLFLKTKSKARPKLTFTAQYSFQDWTKYKEEFESYTSTDSLRKASGINFGIQYIPHVLSVGSGKVNPIKLLNYRIGFYADKNYFNVNNNAVNGWGVTAGLGIPLLMSSSSFSMINISFEYGSRGTTSNDLLLENYYGVHIGIAFSPDRRIDRWFVKRKYD